jgi:hypothetical protein
MEVAVTKLSEHNLVTKKLGLLLGDEDDWPSALEALARRFLKPIRHGEKTYAFELERVRIHPFALDAPTSYSLVIDRLAWWHTTPREWLKKAALVNGTYLLNNPFTFQSMEKHSAYCAMIRLGLHIPETWLLPPKEGPDTEKFRRTAERYHDFFDLPAIAEGIGYPLFMKPFDGGGWRGVSGVRDAREVQESYDASGASIMHLQKAVEFEVFVRSLGVGPQIISLSYDPGRPLHGRYSVRHDFLDAKTGREARAITKIINAVFRWEFNSCEALLKGGTLWPIDFANACPDIALTSLHYYFPWAIKSLLAWSVFCGVTERRPRITMDLENYFEIADSERSYDEKLVAYERLADAYFETERFEAFKLEELRGLDEAMWELVGSAEFDRVLRRTVETTFPAHEHEGFTAHYRGLMQHWLEAERPHA